MSNKKKDLQNHRIIFFILWLITFNVTNVQGQKLKKNADSIGQIDTIESVFLVEFDLQKYYTVSDVLERGKYLQKLVKSPKELYKKEVFLYLLESEEFLKKDSLLFLKIKKIVKKESYFSAFSNIRKEQWKLDYRKVGVKTDSSSIPIYNYFCDAYYVCVKAKIVVMCLGKRKIQVPVVKEDCYSQKKGTKNKKQINTLKSVMAPYYVILDYIDFSIVRN